MSKKIFLFNIKYKNKRFAIYSDNFMQRHFLQILDDNSLCYPEKEDYIFLDEIFNVKEIHKVYSISKSVEFEPKVIDKEDGKIIKKDTSDLKQDDEPQIGISYEETPYEVRFIKRIKGEEGTIIFCENNDEVRKFLDVKNPSFEDVRIAILNNSNIPEKFKKIAIEYVDEIERNNPSQDLAILYYNIYNLRNIKTPDSSNEIIQGYFDKFKKEIAVSANDNTLLVFKHELTHATYSVDVELGDTHIIKDIIHPTLTRENKMIVIGMSINEGLTDNHRTEITGKTLSNKDKMSYEQFQDEMQICSKLIGVSTEELLNNNIKFFMDRMYEKGIDNIGTIVSLMDTNLNGMIRGEVQIENVEAIRLVVYSLIFENFIKNAIEEGKTSDEIYKSALELLDSGYIQNRMKKEPETAKHYLYRQLELRRNIMSFVNSLLENENMPVKDIEELFKEYSTFENLEIKKLALNEDVEKMIKDLCIYINHKGEIKFGYAIVKEDGTFSIISSENLIENKNVKSWEYMKKLLETDEMEISMEDGSNISFDIKADDIKLERRITDVVEEEEKDKMKNIYVQKDSNGNESRYYYINTIDRKKVFFDFNMKKIDLTLEKDDAREGR